MREDLISWHWSLCLVGLLVGTKEKLLTLSVNFITFAPSGIVYFLEN